MGQPTSRSQPPVQSRVWRFAHDNFAAAHLLTVIPFILVYLLTSRDRRLRALALVSAPFVLNVFILCNSRGGTLGLAAALLVGLLIAHRKHRIRSLAVAAAAPSVA